MTDETPARTCVRAVRIDDARRAPLRAILDSRRRCAAGQRSDPSYFFATRWNRSLNVPSLCSVRQQLAILEHAREKPIEWSNALERPGFMIISLASGDPPREFEQRRNQSGTDLAEMLESRSTNAMCAWLKKMSGSFLARGRLYWNNRGTWHVYARPFGINSSWTRGGVLLINFIAAPLRTSHSPAPSASSAIADAALGGVTLKRPRAIYAPRTSQPATISRHRPLSDTRCRLHNAAVPKRVLHFPEAHKRCDGVPAFASAN